MHFNQRQQEYYNRIIDTAKQYNNDGLFAEVDMHMHTAFSDGMFDLEQIIFIAKNINLKQIMITDHNTCLPAFESLKKIESSQLNNIQVNIGCEIATKIIDYRTSKYIPIEILAYFADPYKIQEFLNSYDFTKASQKEQLEELKYTALKLGLTVSDDINLPVDRFATEILCRDLTSYEENREYFDKIAPRVWNDPKLFYKKLTANPTSSFYIDTTKKLPHCSDTVNAIIEAGGIPFVAHPCLYFYENNDDVSMMLNTIVKTTNIQGIEVYHSTHTAKQRDFLQQYAIEKNLKMSGGTDFHNGYNSILGYGGKKAPITLKENQFDWLKR